MVTAAGSGLRVLVVGCGSIGKRHLAYLTTLEGIDGISVFTGNSRCLEGFEPDRRIRAIASLDDAMADIAVIANETNKHAETAVSLARRGMHLFIEKPVAVSAEQAEAMMIDVAGTGVKVHVGYNLRFLGIMDRMRTLLAGKALGTPYFARIEAGQYLPDWRPGTDYQSSYSASAARGGGVALDLSHEIDYMRYLFGDPVSWQVARSRVSGLTVDSDDMFDGLYRYAGDFVCSVHLDYLQRTKKRKIRIAGSQGELVCDLVARRMTLTTQGRETIVDDESLFDVAGTYPVELRQFLRVVTEGATPRATMEDGVRALRLIEECPHA